MSRVNLDTSEIQRLKEAILRFDGDKPICRFEVLDALYVDAGAWIKFPDTEDLPNLKDLAVDLNAATAPVLERYVNALRVRLTQAAQEFAERCSGW